VRPLTTRDNSLKVSEDSYVALAKKTPGVEPPLYMTILAFAAGAVVGGDWPGTCVPARGHREKYFSFLAHELNTQVTGLQTDHREPPDGRLRRSATSTKMDVGHRHRVDLLGCMIGDLRDVSHWEFGGRVRLMPEGDLP